MINSQTKSREQWNEMVLKWSWAPEVRAYAFFTGFIFGYIMYLKKHSLIKLNLTKTQIKIGWTLTFISHIIVRYINVIWHYGYTPWNQVVSAIWSIILTPLWTFGIAFIIFTCSSTESTNSSSLTRIINSVLSWSLFRPLARVSYMVYLTHMLIIWSYSGSRFTLIETSMMTGIYICVSHIFFSYILGFICTVLIESPFIEIQKLFMMRYSKSFRNVKCNEDQEVMKVLTTGDKITN